MCRNPSLQKMFMLIGRAEKAGSGVDKIMSGWQDAHWRKPFLEIYSQPDRVKLTMPMFSVIPESTLSELNQRFDNISELTADELTVLSFCMIEGSISNHRLQYVLNMHRTDITSLLKKLCEKGYLESDNNGRWTTYKINRKVDSFEKKVATSVKSFDKELDNRGREEEKVATSEEKVATSEEKVATSEEKVATSNNAISSQYYGKNLKRDELTTAILTICKDRYVKKEELSEILGKSENYIRNKVLPRLLKEGKLEKYFPFTHNHPQQGYKTTEEYAKGL